MAKCEFCDDPISDEIPDDTVLFKKPGCPECRIAQDEGEVEVREDGMKVVAKLHLAHPACFEDFLAGYH